MLISGEQFGCAPGCDIFAIVYAQLEDSSSFSPWDYPLSMPTEIQAFKDRPDTLKFIYMYLHKSY